MFPTPHTVVHSTLTVTGENALGQVTTESVARPRPVIGWRPKSTGDGEGGVLAGRVHTELYLLTTEPDWRDGDSVELPDGRVFEVVGDVEDYNTGPFAPGLVFGYRVLLRGVHHEPS